MERLFCAKNIFMNSPQENTNISIKDLALDDRPREKMAALGRQVLSEAELIAILIGSGSRNESAVQLAQRILSSVGNDLNNLARLSIKDLQKFKGIGEAKAISIVAALELGRRRKSDSEEEVVKITSSKSAFLLLQPKLQDLPHEEFWVLLLSRSNKVMDIQMVSRGGVAGTVADVKIIMKLAIERLASGIILSHNHPSGNLKPSQADLNLTQKVKEASKFMDVALLDHLILADNAYYSFADEGVL
ncbi:MAG: DNA repair protein RadC [Flavobacteriales bacterium]|jgi:DNA repair protein RadC